MQICMLELIFGGLIKESLSQVKTNYAIFERFVMKLMEVRRKSTQTFLNKAPFNSVDQFKG